MGLMKEWIEEDPDNRGICELCGERYDMLGPPSMSEVGEFWVPEGKTLTGGMGQETKGPESVMAHAQCGYDRGLELA